MSFMLTWTIRYAVVCTITPFLFFAQTVNDEEGTMDTQPNLIFFLRCIVAITHPTTCWCLLKLFWSMTSTSNAEWLKIYFAVDIPLKEPEKPIEVLMANFRLNELKNGCAPYATLTYYIPEYFAQDKGVRDACIARWIDQCKEEEARTNREGPVVIATPVASGNPCTRNAPKPSHTGPNLPSTNTAMPAPARTKEVHLKRADKKRKGGERLEEKNAGERY